MSATDQPTATAREWQLTARPKGWPVPDDFRFVARDLPPLGPGEVRVRNTYVSVDPYMRGRMDDTPSYVPPFQLFEPLEGGAVGRVEASRSEDLAEGDLVLHGMGWRDLAQGAAAAFRRLDPVPGVPESAYLHVLGMTGLTAYVGLLDVAGMRPGDTVFISGAAGAVGGVAGQIARLKGAARVVGSAGSDAKVDLLTSKYGYDAAFNYKSGDVRSLLRDAAPDGIDVYFDNVGGDHLEAALEAFNRDGRTAVCGMISAYNSEEPQAAPRNLSEVVKKGLTLKGFTVGFYTDRMKDFVAEAGQWLSEGSLVYDETVVDGVDNTLQAFLDMMQGANTGKMLVRV